MRDHSLQQAVAAIPSECYARPAWKACAYIARAWVLFVISVALLLRVDHPVALLPLWLFSGLAIGGLFVLGHDAAHGALFDSPRLCRAVGRLLLLPSLHAYEPWVVGHNRLHHGHTGSRGIDFVWHPLTRAEYENLPALGRFVHRLEWMPGGAGLYYLRAVWWQRMMRLVPPARLRAAFRRDRLIVWGYVVTMCALTGWMSVKVVVIPWLVWNLLIGTTVYLHHIGPDLPWHQGRRHQALQAQVDVTTNYHLPVWLNLFWQNIFIHVPHHIDPRIPFHALPRAAAALVPVLGPAVRDRTLRLADYVRIARRCKLYDFDHNVWTTYAGPTNSPNCSIGAATAS